MTDIRVFVAEDFELPSASGLGFYGDAGFGAPVPLGQFQGRTFVTSADGTVEGFECNNCKLYAGGSLSGVGGVSGVIVGQTGDGITLRSLPNYLATLNVRFEHGSAVRTQNVRFYVHDGVSVNNRPSGLRAYCAEIIHPGINQDETGEGDQVWSQIYGSDSVLALIDSPGTSGLRPLGALTVDARHDWYICVSCSPTTPGSRQYGFSCELEFM